MKLYFFTIVLDGMPWITHHLPIFNSLPKEIDWEWHVVEGVAAPVKDTNWCKPIPARVSRDGTHEYLQTICRHPRVFVKSNPIWPGKVAMCNYALGNMHTPGILMEIDADELWSEENICATRNLFFNVDYNCADFKCQYFVGPNIVVDRVPGTWTNDYRAMWRRAWTFFPGMTFECHEPPVVSNQKRTAFTVEDTENDGILFQHYAYATIEQVRFKEEYYGYAGAVNGWCRLQENTVWPAKLRDYFPWVKDETTARPLYR